MAITGGTLLDSIADDTNATSYATSGATTGGASRLILCFVSSQRSGATPSKPSVTGQGLTFAECDTTNGTATFNTVATSRSRITVYRAMGSPTAGEFTVDFGTETQIGCLAHFIEFDGVDTSGSNGSGAIVQAAANAANGVLSSATLTVTLAAFGSSNNRPCAGFSLDINNTVTHESGWTEIHDAAIGAPNQGLETQWHASSADTTATGKPAATADMGGVAVEIKAAAAATTTLRFLSLLGVGT